MCWGFEYLFIHYDPDCEAIIIAKHNVTQSHATPYSVYTTTHSNMTFFSLPLSCILSLALSPFSIQTMTH
eukprot:m.96808 g.96808  ORF g.96808 m.96808 type:complete len:70 (-) comp8974_c1_seq8:1661-1870(-)